MGKWGMGVVGFVCVPGIVFSVAYAVGCSKDAANRDWNGEGSLGMCPVDDNPCTVEDCSKGDIEIRTLAAGTPIGPGTTECTRRVCNELNGVMQPDEVPADLDTICAVGVCDGQGNCINSCNDGRLNGGEDGIDCGGPNCGNCNGASCGPNDPCKSGHCVQGVCCNKPCSGECESCETGACLPVPFNTASTTCTFPNACDGLGNCKIATGASCIVGSDCVGLKCRGKCDVNQSCYNSAPCGNKTCVSSICFSGMNKPCSSDADCDNNNCVFSSPESTMGLCK